MGACVEVCFRTAHECSAADNARGMRRYQNGKMVCSGKKSGF